jgi:DinB superfamily
LRSLETIHENLGRAQGGFLRAADAVRAEQWAMRPEASRWSAGELVAHLISVERAVLNTADRIMQHPPKRVPLIKRFHLPMVLVESRVIRRRSPIPQDPALLSEKEGMLAELRGVRERTLAFMEETRGRDLSPYRYRHAFLGSLNLYEWLQMIASHEVRHTKQMREIAVSLPKAVASLQK